MSLELADIFRQYGPAYRARDGERLLPSHQRVMRAIEQCRTAALGGQVYACGQCDHVQYRYHSCRNRHCPKCQHPQGQHWLEKQQALLLPVPYFLLTFTLPAELRPCARQHHQLFYHLLFRASAAATQQLARDERFIGGQIGMVGVLHTQALQKTPDYAKVPARVWRDEWVVHCKPVGSGQTALKYLAPYIFRVALSNRRLVKLDNDQVTFRYTQAQTGLSKFCTLPAEQFIHRFLQHVLPKGFVKVRYYGLFARCCGARLAALQHKLRQAQPTSDPSPEAASPTPVRSGTPPPPFRCPRCGSGMALAHTLPALARSPP